ncbi:MAG TPA: hypothetical protein VIH14_05880 [Anaerolineales bacterium]
MTDFTLHSKLALGIGDDSAVINKFEISLRMQVAGPAGDVALPSRTAPVASH